MEGLKKQTNADFKSMVPVIERLIWPLPKTGPSWTQQTNVELRSLVPVVEQLIWPLPVQSKDGIEKTIKQERNSPSKCIFPSDYLDLVQLSCTSIQADQKVEDEDYAKIKSESDQNESSETVNEQETKNSHTGDTSATERISRTTKTSESTPIRNTRKPLCDKNINKRMKFVDGGKQMCKICCQSFKRGYLQHHIKTQHSSVAMKVHKCEKCEKVFMSKSGLQRHAINRHGAVKRLLFTCDVCGEDFKSELKLSRHREKKHEENEKFTCAHCYSQFKNKSTLINHMRVMHLPPTLECDVCHLLCHNTKQLKSHLLTEHSIGRSVFDCDLCEKTFNRGDRLKYHMDTAHPTGDKKFKCEHCEKSFFVVKLYKQHLITHVGARKFNCEMCEKSFKFGHHLKSHMSVHVPKSSEFFDCNAEMNQSDVVDDGFGSTPCSKKENINDPDHFLSMYLDMY